MSAPANYGEIGDSIAGAYINILNFIDRAHAKPKLDWAADIETMLVDPYKGSFTEGLSTMNQAGLHGVGHIQATALLTSLDGDSAELTTCMDVSQSDLVDAAGNSAIVGESDSNKWRFPEHVIMIKDSGTWKLSSVHADRSSRC